MTYMDVQEPGKLSKNNEVILHYLHNLQGILYKEYQGGAIDENKYLFLIKSIDKAIDRIELSILQGIPPL